jgi:hypothetical protein
MDFILDPFMNAELSRSFITSTSILTSFLVLAMFVIPMLTIPQSGGGGAASPTLYIISISQLVVAQPVSCALLKLSVDKPHAVWQSVHFAAYLAWIVVGAVGLAHEPASCFEAKCVAVAAQLSATLLVLCASLVVQVVARYKYGVLRAREYAHHVSRAYADQLVYEQRFVYVHHGVDVVVVRHIVSHTTRGCLAAKTKTTLRVPRGVTRGVPSLPHLFPVPAPDVDVAHVFRALIACRLVCRDVVVTYVAPFVRGGVRGGAGADADADADETELELAPLYRVTVVDGDDSGRGCRAQWHRSR